MHDAMTDAIEQRRLVALVRKPFGSHEQGFRRRRHFGHLADGLSVHLEPGLRADARDLTLHQQRQARAIDRELQR